MAEGRGDGRKGILPDTEDISIDAAFLSSNESEAYIFKKNKCALFDYTANKLVKRPLLICEMFPSLARTPFGKCGIGCAFKIPHKSEAFIFCDIQCARLNFETPGTILIKGPLTIASMFPFLMDTEFAKGVDAAFTSSNDNEAYLFRESQYAHINYSDSAPELIDKGLIIERFPSLGSSIFKDGINAAFASRSNNEAYIFHGIYCGLFKFALEHKNDEIDVNEITKVWPCLRNLWCPGLDVHNHSHSEPAESGGGHVHGVL